MPAVFLILVCFVGAGFTLLMFAGWLIFTIFRLLARHNFSVRGDSRLVLPAGDMPHRQPVPRPFLPTLRPCSSGGVGEGPAADGDGKPVKVMQNDECRMKSRI
jgi:hypothetical protein